MIDRTKLHPEYPGRRLASRFAEARHAANHSIPDSSGVTPKSLGIRAGALSIPEFPLRTLNELGN